MGQQKNCARLSDTHGEANSRVARQRHSAGQEDVSLSAQWFGKSWFIYRYKRRFFMHITHRHV